MAPNPNLEQLHEAGVSIWLDTLSRQLVQTGEFGELIRDSSVTGATSNPTIFAKAITGSHLYDSELRQLADAAQRDPTGAVLLARAQRRARGRALATPDLRSE